MRNNLIRRFAVLMSALAAVTAMTAAPASAAAGTHTRPVKPGELVPAAGARTDHRLTSRTDKAAATTCLVNISAPVRAGAAKVGVDYSVTCDQEVVSIYGIIGIFRNAETTPLENTVDVFDLGRFGGGFQIVRNCASGTLYGYMRVIVTFKTGTPSRIDTNFAGPAAPISC
ncbi:hypothetical protein [Actinoplanes sp. N902-109]|uniref:hypothetical protein n=1 Tax=Actinoplanes sp. (strain N902-109) TaxID=649831 RepID=UPI0003296079|nr:hypothetical protein [Actinoplanes sp. N902-109]AGL15870.1 hypothetical protein L083_2360 [Actinoplanes sp. N902-109]